MKTKKVFGYSNMTGTLIPPSRSELDKVEKRIGEIPQQISSLQNQLSLNVQGRGNCKSNNCRDDHNRVIREIEGTISALQSELARQQANQKRLLQEYNAAMAAYTDAQARLNMTNPELIKAQGELAQKASAAQAAAAETGRKSLVTWAIVGTALILVLTGVYLYIKMRK